MKPLQLFLFCLLMSFYSNAQIVDIPDANFKAALISRGIDTSGDGQIQESEALAVTYLDLYSANLSDLTGISSFINLSTLLCGTNQLTSLDLSGLTELTELQCDNNMLTSLNISGLDSLIILECYYNLLTSLDVSGFSNLSYLDCRQNELSTLNFTNCTNLINIDATYNNLTTLDFTGIASGQQYSFNHNNISSILFPSGFEMGYFRADNNEIIHLDLSNVVSLDLGSFNSNLIETINIKNGNEDFDQIDFAPNSSVQFICADDNELEEIIDFSEIINHDFLVSSYCTFDPGGDYNVISGSIRLDLENNGCDAADSLLPNVFLHIDDGVDQGFVSTNLNGEYRSFVGVGSFTITPNIENPSWFMATPNNASVPFVDNNNFSVQDFCFQPVGTHQDVEALIVPIFAAEAGFDATYQIVYKNKGNQIASGDIEFTYDDSVLDFVSSSMGTASQTTGSLIWNYANLNPFESRSITVILNVNSPMETPAVTIGDQLDFYATINPISSDETPTDNQFNLNQIVAGSYDPNDITCLEGDIVSPDKIGDYLHYNINFENTGTAAATFVVVKDIIDDTNYDLSSMQILYASHPMETRVIANKMELIFDNINLGPTEKGNVVFKIKTVTSLTIGDYVENKAEIYFDYNFPVETNAATTTFNTLSVENFENINSVSVHPNPTSGKLFIDSKYDIESLGLYDIQGRMVQNYTVSEANSLDITNLSKGVYFLKIVTLKGEATKKIIKD